MASNDDDGTAHRPDPSEERLRTRLRVISALTFLVLICILSLADTFGRSADLHASEFIFGSLVGAFLLVAGIEGAARFLGRK